MKIKYLNEIWRDIKGYEGKYQISNFGRVRNVKTGKVLKLYPNEKGYLRIHIGKKQYRVHRLVAIAFIPNPNNYPDVNHKDENKQNNFVYIDENGNYVPELSNLEWCTKSYNHSYGTRTERQAKTQSEQWKTKKAV